MAPNNNKRKRERQPSDGGRPSPHQPESAQLMQGRSDDQNNRGRNRRGRPNNHNNIRRDSVSSQSGSQGQQQQQQQQQHQQQQQQPPSPSPRRNAPAAQPSTMGPPSTTPTPAPSAQPQASNKPVTEPSTAPPTFSRPPFCYDKLSDDRINNWKGQGRAAVVAQGTHAREAENTAEISSLFLEFVHAMVDRRLNATDAGTAVKEIIGDQAQATNDSYTFAPYMLLLDSLAIVLESESAAYNPSIREFLVATNVSPTTVRQVLDAPLLEQLGLIRSSFTRVGVRQATNLLYRQANYNLLREETEGYSKLISEVFTVCTTQPGPDPETAAKTFEKIKALIGTFDLDVGRVLDVTLDVAAAVLIKQYQFIVKLFRVSSWWPRPQFEATSTFVGGLPIWATPDYPSWTTLPEDEAVIAKQKLARDTAFWARAREIHLGAYFELGGRQVTDEALEQWKLTTSDTGENGVVDFQRKWIEDTKTLPPPGNQVAAQLLGFKLRYYSLEVRGKDDVLPANLLYLAALLIKVGFLSITDLYPHLWPSDDDMEAVRDKAMAEIEQVERAARGGPKNALLAAGVLPDEDDAPGGGRRVPAKVAAPEVKPTATPAAAPELEKKKPELSEPLEQKIRLLEQLLTLGALPEVLFFLGRFPWVLEAYPKILDGFHRVLHASIEKVYNDVKPKCSANLEAPPRKSMADADQSNMPKGSVRLYPTPRRRFLRWPNPDTFDNKFSVTQDYRHYWEEWSDNIPQCQTIEDVFTLCNSLLNISGVRIGKDEALLSKLARIGAKSLDTDTSPQNMARWLELLKRLLVPALSHTKSNVSVANAVWDLLKRYPLTTRYLLYAEWYEGQVSRLPAMRMAFAHATSDTRGTMKRISRENVNEMAKRLAKTCYSSPGIVFKVAFEQLESYPNLIDTIVGCAEFFTEMSYDVLVWSLVNSLGGSRSRTQSEHALTTSKWLQALAKFSAKVFKKYLALDPTPVLKYVNEQLSAGNSTDLIILKEFITSMGGLIDTIDFTDYHLLSMAGGERLQRIALIAAEDRRFDNIRSSKRLVQALTDSKLAARFLILIAQYRQAAIFRVPEDEAHIKYLSSLVDDAHQALVRYLDFLWANLDPTTFDSLIPSIDQLMQDFGLDANLAFLLGRASLSHRMFPWKSKKEVENKTEKAAASKVGADKDGDVDMDAAKSTEEIDTAAETTTAESQKPDDQSLIRVTLQPLIDAVQETMRPEIWQTISPELYVTFWALQLGDLFVPDKQYRQEKEKLKTKEIAISRDRSDMARHAQDRRLAARKELMQLQIELSEESSEHMMRSGKWKFYLMKQFQSTFPEPRAEPKAVADMLLEQCFIPRVLLSPQDAEYTFRYVKALHEWNAPGFKLMTMYDRLFNANRLRTLIFMSTVGEAENLGRFLKLVLLDLSRWHKNESVARDRDSRAARDKDRVGAYDKEGKGTAEQARFGFALTVDENGKPDSFVEHAQFKDMLFGWHKNLNMALKACLAGTEWMHIRNAITVLKCVLDFFPAIDFMANQFMAQLQKIAVNEAASKTGDHDGESHRVDLSVAAQGAMSELQRRKNNWVMVQAFRPNANGASQGEDKSIPPLRPTAAEFKPSTTKNNVEEEDGEVNDAKGQRSQSSGRDSQSKREAQHNNSLPAKPVGPSRDVPMKDVPRHPRPSTPNLATGPNSAGVGSGRAPTRPSNLPQRPPQNLPNRPDVAIPNHHDQPRGSEYDARELRDSKSSRDIRGPRESRDQDSKGREHREPRDNKEAPRNPRDNWAQETARLDRVSDRRAADGPQDPNHVELGTRHSSRGNRDEQRSDRKDRSEQGHSTASTTKDAEPQINPERAALFGKDSSDRSQRPSEADRADRSRRPGPAETINPERAAVLGDAVDNTPTRSGPRDDGRQRGRALSPRRSGKFDGQVAGQGYEDRHGRSNPPHAPQPWGSGRNPRDNSPAHGAFRGDRSMDRLGRDGAGFQRTPQGPEPGPPRASHQDQNYGRLNPAPPSVETPPSGPRGRGRGNARNTNDMQQTTPARPSADPRAVGHESIRPQPDERHPPTGPASNRNRRGYDLSNTDTPVNTPNQPTAPGPGVHPDRLGHVGPPAMSSPAAQNQAPGSGVHPDRMGRLGSGPQSSPPSRPQPVPSTLHQQHGPPPQIHNPRSYQPNMPDRNGMQQPMNNLPHIDNGVPTGPASGADRRGGRRQLANINNMISHTPTEPGRSNSNRRQQRPMLANSDVQVLTGGSPAGTPAQERQDPMRSDSSHRDASNGDDHNRGNLERSQSHRSDRGRSSRSRRSSRERGDDKGRDRESKEHREHREHRDRRSGAGGEERESRRSDREPMGPPPNVGGTPGGRDLVVPGQRNDDRSGSRSGRSGNRGEERGHKRRSGDDMPGSSEKRVRR